MTTSQMTGARNGLRLLWFLVRVTTVQVVTYIAFGVLFMNLLNYAGHYAANAAAACVRLTTDPVLAYAPLVEIGRGVVIALGLLPLRGLLVRNRWGGFELWGILLALSWLGAPNGLIESAVYSTAPLGFTLLNQPEVILQLLAFALLVVAWERWIERRRQASVPIVESKRPAAH